MTTVTEIGKAETSPHPRLSSQPWSPGSPHPVLLPDYSEMTSFLPGEIPMMPSSWAESLREGLGDWWRPCQVTPGGTPARTVPGVKCVRVE